MAFLRQLPAALRYRRFQQARPGARVRLWLMDESRFGLLTDLRRRLTLPGVAPVGRYQYQRANFWLYGAVDVLSSTSYFRAFTHLRAVHFQRFVEDLVNEDPTAIHLMLLDNSRTHLARALHLPTQLSLHFLPPYSPDLNPIERLWHHLKGLLAGHLPASLWDLQERLGRALETLDDDTLHSLVSPRWLMAAAHNARLIV